MPKKSKTEQPSEELEFDPAKSESESEEPLLLEPSADEIEEKIDAIDMSAGPDPSHDPTALYLSEIGYSPLLTAEEEVKFGRLALQGDAAARERMIVSNLRLVVKIARHYINRGISFLDLIEEGNLGLMHAVEKFDPERGFRFSTYATWWIRQTIERGIMNQSRAVRLPVHVIKELNIYLRAARALTQKLNGADPTPEQIAEYVDKPVEDVKRLLRLNEGTSSIDTAYGSDPKRSLLETLADEDHPDPFKHHQDEDMRMHIEIWLKQLPEKQQEILARRFGLLGHEPMTLEEVGTAVGLTRERVRQIQVDALRQLRKIVEEHGLSSDNFND